MMDGFSWRYSRTLVRLLPRNVVSLPTEHVITTGVTRSAHTVSVLLHHE